MRTRDNTSLGIDLHDSEIRVVQVRTVGKTVQVLKTHAVPTPAGAVVHGQIREPAALSIALRRMLESMGIADVIRATFAVGGPSSVVRTLSLPPSPPEELGALVAGEVEYHQIVHAGGSYGYAVLSKPESGGEGYQVAVMGAEGNITEPLGQISTTTELLISGMEPAPFATYRALAAYRDTQDGVLLLALRESSCDLLFARGTELAFIRRIEIGSVHLNDELELLRRVPSLANDSYNRFGNRSYTETPRLDELVIDLQRSIEYLAREHPEFASVDRLTFVPDQTEVFDLGSALERRLAIPVEVPPFDELADFGFRFATAYGLALFTTPQVEQGLPPVDLYTEKRALTVFHDSLRNLAGSIAVSAAAILLGVVGYALYGRQIASTQAEAASLTRRATAVQGEAVAALDAQAKEEKRYRLLASQGIPLGPLCEELSRTLAPGVGLSSIAVSADQRVVISGEAKSESEMISTLDSMKRSPLLSDLSILAFDRKDEQALGGLSFQFAGNTVSLARLAQVPASPTSLKNETVQQVSMR